MEGPIQRRTCRNSRTARINSRSCGRKVVLFRLAPQQRLVSEDNVRFCAQQFRVWGRMIRFQRSLFLSMAICLAASVHSLQASPQSTKPHANSQIALQQWIREVIDNEIKAQTDDHTLWAYQESVQRNGKEELREICETSIGEIDRLMALNGHPLSLEQQRKEDQRIRQFLAKPTEVRKQQQKRIEDMDEGRTMLESFPRAFHYESVGVEGDLIRISFNPDSSFAPSTHQQEVLRHLEGIMWINQQHKRMVRIEGRLISDVKFLGGLLGSLDGGGSFSLQQGEVASGHWEMLDLDVEIRGRALLFKTLTVQERRERRHYREIPGNLTLQQGAELLRQDSVAYDQTLPKRTAID
jgi:hypothetical protein